MSHARHVPPVRPTLTYAEAFELIEAIDVAYAAVRYSQYAGQRRGRLTRAKAKLYRAINEGFAR